MASMPASGGAGIVCPWSSDNPEGEGRGRKPEALGKNWSTGAGRRRLHSSGRRVGEVMPGVLGPRPPPPPARVCQFPLPFRPVSRRNDSKYGVFMCGEESWVSRRRASRRIVPRPEAVPAALRAEGKSRAGCPYRRFPFGDPPLRKDRPPSSCRKMPASCRDPAGRGCAVRQPSR